MTPTTLGRLLRAVLTARPEALPALGLLVRTTPGLSGPERGLLLSKIAWRRGWLAGLEREAA